MHNLKKVDYFRKYTNEDKIQTIVGACISLLALALIIMFSMFEFMRYRTPLLNREVTIMSNRDNALVNDTTYPMGEVPLNINLTLFNTPCESKDN